MVQFSWYSWVALSHEFTSLMEKNSERVIFLAENEIDASTKLFPHEYAKNNHNPEKLAPIKITDSTVSFRCNGIHWNT